MTLLEKLNVGADAAITLSELAERMGVTRREAEVAVNAARHAGIPILSGNPGVWLAVSPGEARQWAARQRSRGIHILETASAVERAAERMADPLTLWAA